MSIVSQDEEFMESMKFQPHNQSTAGSNQSTEEKQLLELQTLKQEQLIKQNQQFLNDLFHDNSTQPIKVRNVQITNGDQFRDSFVAAQFAPLLEERTVMSLGNYLDVVDNILKGFLKLGIVENIMCSTHQVNAVQPTRSPFPFVTGGARDNAGAIGAINVVPVFNALPVKRFFAKTGTNIGNGEGDGYIQFQLRNIFGGGENLVFDAVTGTKTQSSYLLNYNQPVWNNPNFIWENQFSINSRKLDWIQSVVQSKSIVNKIYTQFHHTKVNHELVMENTVRNLSNNASRSFEVMQQSGQLIKSSVAYNISYDSRDNKHLPFSGRYIQCGVEYNGLLGLLNAFPYVKTASQAQQAWNLPFLNSHLLATVKCGLLYPLLAERKSGMSLSMSLSLSLSLLLISPSPFSSSLLDRFYIGGPNDVRSFMLNGLGPKDQNSYIGGDMFMNGGFSLFMDIPRYKDSNFKLHNFVNWGRIASMSKDQSLVDNLKKMSHSYCLSCGFGILYNHPMARFELNFVLPLIVNERDLVRKGIQYGIGVSFL